MFYSEDGGEGSQKGALICNPNMGCMINQDHELIFEVTLSSIAVCD